MVEHLAGDVLPDPRRHKVSGLNQSLAMTGWWWMGEGLHAPVDVWGDEATRLDNQIDVYSKAFLGLTVACARCHDHKFDPLSAADYTSLVGVLQSSRRTYALDDPHGHIAQHNRTLASRVQSSVSAALQGQSASITSEQMVAWTERLIQRWKEQPDETRKAIGLSHPLYPLLPLIDSQNAEDLVPKLAALTDGLRAAQSAWHKWESESVLLADFTNGLPTGWYVSRPILRLQSWVSNRATF